MSPADDISGIVRCATWSVACACAADIESGRDDTETTEHTPLRAKVVVADTLLFIYLFRFSDFFFALRCASFARAAYRFHRREQFHCGKIERQSTQNVNIVRAVKCGVWRGRRRDRV